MTRAGEAAGRDGHRRRGRRARRGRPAVVQRAAELRLVGCAGRLLRLRRDGAGRAGRHGRAARDAPRKLLERKVLPKLDEPVRYAGALDASLSDLIAVGEGARVRGAGREAPRQPVRAGPALGRVAEDARQPGQEFVIGGYTVGTKTFDALIFGYYEGEQADLRRAHAQRLHAGDARAAVQEVPRRWRSRNARSRTCRKRRAGAGGRD